MIVNLEPRKMMGFESNGMIMSVRDGDKFRVVEFPDDIKAGADIDMNGKEEKIKYEVNDSI